MRRRSSHQQYHNNARGYGNHGKHSKPSYLHIHYHNLTPEQVRQIRVFSRSLRASGLEVKLLNKKMR